MLKETGDIYYILSEYQNAYDSYERALRLRQIVKDQNGKAEALNDLGHVDTYLGRLDKSLQKCSAALSLSRQLNDKRLESRALSNIGFTYLFLGKLAKALEHLQQAQTLSTESGDSLIEAQVLLNLAYVYNSLGELQKALAYYDQALPRWRSAGHLRGQARTLTAMGGVYTALGERQKALDYHLHALKLAHEVGDLDGQAVTLNGIGYVYEAVGDNERALDAYLKALDSFTIIKHLAGQAQTSQYVGNIYLLLNDRPKAQEYFVRGLTVSRSMGDRAIEALNLNSIGDLYQSAGEIKKSLAYYKQALSIYQKNGNQRAQAYTLNRIGDASDLLGDTATSLEYYHRALSLIQSSGDRELEIPILYSVARLQRNRRNLDEARTTIESSLQIIEALRTKVISHGLRASYFASVHKNFELYVDVLMQMHKQRPSEGFDIIALQVSEQARARSLIDVLNEAHADIRRDVAPELLERERSVQQALNQKENDRMLSGDKSAPEKVAAMEREIRALTAEYDQIKAEIRKKSPRYAALAEQRKIDLKEIQTRVLDDRTLLLEYMLGDERSYLWAVTREGILSYELPGRPVIEKIARRVYELLTDRQTLPGETPAQSRMRLSEAEGEYWQLASELSHIVLGPVVEQLGAKRLVIIADGALQFVPFGALPSPNVTEPGTDSGGVDPSSARDNVSPLITMHEIVNLPSAAALVAIREEKERRVPAPKSVAIIADPVFERDDSRLQQLNASTPNSGEEQQQPRPVELNQALRDAYVLESGGRLPRLLASIEEAEAIISFVPAGEGLKAVGFDANRGVVTDPKLGQYRVIHFATHGILNSQHPELSGLVLSLFDERGQPQDGFLRLHDIYNLRLPADVVVLSACNTALGKDIKGEGLLGLTRGFMYAGATSIVASLWKVDDAATAELMKVFYQKMLKEDLPPAAALRETQIYMWKKKQWRSPYYWAAFVLQGEYQEKVKGEVESSTAGNYALVLVATGTLVLILIGSFIYSRRRKGLRRPAGR